MRELNECLEKGPVLQILESWVFCWKKAYVEWLMFKHCLKLQFHKIQVCSLKKYIKQWTKNNIIT